MFSSPLQRAIKRGRQNPAEMADELRNLDDYEVHSRKDAVAICQALAELPPPDYSGESFSSPVYALTALFQDLKSAESPAFEVLVTEGQSQLIRIFHTTIDDAEDTSDLLFILKVLAMYGTEAGAQTIIDAARRPLDPDAYMWHVILGQLGGEHPQRDHVLAALSDPLPEKFMAVALLDCANHSMIESDLARHPFDSPAGAERLKAWLRDSNREKFSYAHSATAALPFINHPSREQLFALAMDHADPAVQIEAAWAAGKLGREGGLKMLARYCLEPEHSAVAQRYLEELDREDLVPPAAQEPSFQALAEFSQWLAHPNELGRSPDAMEIVDHRTLSWPPAGGEPCPLWIIQYVLKDTTGLEADDVDCGLVGSITWCFFSHRMAERPPEDVYAIHCYFELRHADLIQEVEPDDGDEYASLLQGWNGPPLEDAAVTCVAELSHRLHYPTRLVAVAAAQCEGQAGWAVLDGPRSRWYAAAEMPSETRDSAVLMLHVGRGLLGFETQPDRRAYLTGGPAPPAAESIVAAYEALLDEAAVADPERQADLLDSWGLLAGHFDAYVDAVVEFRGSDPAAVLVDTYERVLQLARQADETAQEKAFSSLGVLGTHFDSYTDALIAADRTEEIRVLLTQLAEYWIANLGRGRRAAVAFKIGDLQQAEQCCLEIKENMEDYFRSEQMSVLAEIWHGRDESNAARQLLIDCLGKLIEKIKSSPYPSDREIYREEFLTHRQTYVRLFADGQSELEAASIPAKPP